MISQRLTNAAKDYISNQGIKATLGNMETAWHDVSNEPILDSDILLVDINGEWIDIQNYNPIMDWMDLVEKYAIVKWSYIQDLTT